jgi:hypothetical protein
MVRVTGVADVGGTMVLLDVGTGREVTVLVTLFGGVPRRKEAGVGVGALVGVGVAVTKDTRAGLFGVVVEVVVHGGSWVVRVGRASSPYQPGYGGRWKKRFRT